MECRITSEPSARSHVTRLDMHPDTMAQTDQSRRSLLQHVENNAEDEISTDDECHDGDTQSYELVDEVETQLIEDRETQLIEDRESKAADNHASGNTNTATLPKLEEDDQQGIVSTTVKDPPYQMLENLKTGIHQLMTASLLEAPKKCEEYVSLVETVELSFLRRDEEERQLKRKLMDEKDTVSNKLREEKEVLSKKLKAAQIRIKEQERELEEERGTVKQLESREQWLVNRISKACSILQDSLGAAPSSDGQT
eukprot:745690-Hanusia_phi.AAC.5